MADGDDFTETWRFDFLLGGIFGVVAFAWHAVQGQYALGFTLLVLLATIAPPMMRFRRRFLRRTYEPSARTVQWARDHPTASRRLRWVVLPVIALIWAWIIWSLIA